MMVADTFAQRLLKDDWTKRILFPQPKDAVWLPKRELGRAKFNLNFVDKELNFEQQALPQPL